MPSAVAGIVDNGGGLRVVVTPKWRMKYHVARGEQLFVVPNLEVQEPIPWDDIPDLIERVQKHVVKSLAPTNHCGECTLCCFISFVKEGDFRKPSNAHCPHCSEQFGCKAYQQRPNVCRSFECIWLKSQSRNDVMPPELRPDRCGVFFAEDTQTNNPLLIEVHGEPNEDARRYLSEMETLGYTVKKITRYVGEE